MYIPEAKTTRLLDSGASAEICMGKGQSLKKNPKQFSLPSHQIKLQIFKYTVSIIGWLSPKNPPCVHQ